MIYPILKEIQIRLQGKNVLLYTQGPYQSQEKIRGRSLGQGISIAVSSFNPGCLVDETFYRGLLQNNLIAKGTISDSGSSLNTEGVISRYETWLCLLLHESDARHAQTISKVITTTRREIRDCVN